MDLVDPEVEVDDIADESPGPEHAFDRDED
jgi:hypothetical protein